MVHNTWLEICAFVRVCVLLVTSSSPVSWSRSLCGVGIGFYEEVGSYIRSLPFLKIVPTHPGVEFKGEKRGVKWPL